MAQDLTVNIKTTSDVPQAMDKAKTATVSFGKQVEDIQKKFSMAFKDVFLSFLGPLALLGVAMNYIGKLIDDNRKKREEANQAAIDDTNELMSAEDRYYAKKQNNAKKVMATTEEAKVERLAITKSFMIMERDRAFEAMTPKQQANLMSGGSLSETQNDPEYQKKIQLLIAEDMKKNPLPMTEAAKQANFRGPDGISNVIGVGLSPGMVIMNEQLRLQQEIADNVRIMAAGKTDAGDIDFTKFTGKPQYSVPAYPKFK
jgi:hypothetical protein